jgi:hypothetical protein
MTPERLEWIEKWLQGWDDYLREQREQLPGEQIDYANMPLEVAVEMGLELVAVCRKLEDWELA